MLTKYFTYNVKIVDEKWFVVDNLLITLLYTKNEQDVYECNSSDLHASIKLKYGSDDFIINVCYSYFPKEILKIHLIQVNEIKFNQSKLKNDRKNKIQTFT